MNDFLVASLYMTIGMLIGGIITGGAFLALHLILF